eukprot:TRINITY_DN4858_c1_g1_i16.p1 TRINITY_DN4858_c1_g1~~TRINITY_DN4858_c1_g1_i16.p1  ORF type:complete len:282 (-),score=40.59 TRINITY_DN4858_c1_g1_i16:329-1174(-)
MNGLHPFHPTTPASSVSSAFLGARSTIDTWHQHLGHLSASSMQRLASAIPITGSSSLSFCQHCQFGKSHKLPFSLSDSVSSQPFEIVHSDLWGPSHVLSVGGFRYYLIFIDGFSRFSWFYPLKCKSDAFSVFLSFKLLVENLLDSRIKCLRTDGGGEFVHTQFHNFLASNGILHQVTCPYTPEQNGCTERKHRHLVETGLTLLFQASMPHRFWTDAFSTATYLINRMPMKSLGFISHLECLFHTVPQYSSFKVFGCSCYPWLRPYNSNKLQPRTKQCVFLG